MVLLKESNSALHSSMRRHEKALVQDQDEIEQIHKLQGLKSSLKIPQISISRDLDSGKHRIQESKSLTISNDSGASDRDDPPMRRSWKGPRTRGLKDLHCADRIFNSVISKNLYRLRTTDQVIDDQIKAVSGLRQRRIDH